MGLSLDLSLASRPKSMSEFLREASMIEDSSLRLSEIGCFVDRLEEERRKVDAFKRELPLCALLLNDAIGRLKEEAMVCRELRDGSVASKRKFDEISGAKVEKEGGDKKTWMSSAQLWIPNTQQRLTGEEEDGSKAPQNCNFGDKGGVFVSFTGRSGQAQVGKEAAPPCLPLMSPASDSSCRVDLQNQLNLRSKPQNQQQQRKERRRWSPELHRRFLNALQKLGGSQAATPKQIRELMQVEGLTNDEVKSHLQKYRLHIRKFPASSAAEAGNMTWMDQNTSGDETNRSVSPSGSPQGPLVTAGGFSSNVDGSMEAEEDSMCS